MNSSLSFRWSITICWKISIMHIKRIEGLLPDLLYVWFLEFNRKQKTSPVSLKCTDYKPTKYDKVVRFCLSPQVKQFVKANFIWVHLHFRWLGESRNSEIPCQFLQANNRYILSTTQLVFCFQLFSRNRR